jgi:Domain of unknown function (DUF4129)
MPSRRDMAVIGLVLTMEILAGYVLIIALGATELVSPRYQIIWLLWLVGFFGVVAGLSVASIKPPDPTPREFSHALSAHWPEGAIEIERLTVAYELRRYGELTFGESDVHSLQECWHRLRRLMRKSVTDELRADARQKR